MNERALIRARFQDVVSLMSLFGEHRKRPNSHHHEAMNHAFAAPVSDAV